MNSSHPVRMATWLAMAVTACRPGMAIPNAAPSAAWREDFAYTLGVQAYIYGFPWIYLPLIRWKYVTQPTDPRYVPYAALNRFWHARQVMDATYRDGGSPQCDTLYSCAWMSLSNEPVILSVPAVTGRYYSIQLASMDSDSFDVIGTRLTGSHAGNYAILGPGWTGALPPGVTALAPSRTPYAFVLGRTLVYNTADATNVHVIQDQYRLTPLSYWGTTNLPPEDHSIWAPFPTNDPLSQWKTLNRAMTENPPNVPSQQAFVDELAQIGLGPGQDVEAVDSATRRGLMRAAVDGLALMQEFNLTGGYGTFVNGWAYPPPTVGRAGQYHDFLTRAAAQCYVGVVASDAEEAIYLNAARDANGVQLTGANEYILRFPPGGLPEVHAFWSITMYGWDHNLVDNPLNRYKVGSYPAGVLKFDADGSLPVYVQHRSPGPDKESNWLPAAVGPYYLLLRTYLPGSNLVQQTWAPPPLVPVAYASASGVGADYDGDARADPAAYNEVAGTWSVLLSGSGYGRVVTTLGGLGGSGKASVSADYDGDRLADPAVYAEADGAWSVMLSSARYSPVPIPGLPFGGAGYSGMPADYDGDRLADPAVYHRERGDWSVRLSSAGYATTAVPGFLGGTGCRAVAADYDGDRLADPAVYEEATGTWSLRLSGAQYGRLDLAGFLGGPGWDPVPGDYDGDGLADPAVRKTDGTLWRILLSGSGYAPVEVPLGL